MKKIVLIFLLALVALFANAEDFSFALITDVHIGSGETAVSDLQNSVNQINTNKNVAFVIVAGDMAEKGDNKSLEICKEELDKLNVKYYITSGNHDTKWSESGTTRFLQLFGSDRFKLEYGGILFLGFNTGPLLRMADGHVLPEDIDWLKAELAKAGREKPVIIVTHYPVKEGDVDNWYELTDAVRDYNIRAFIGGHYHSNELFKYDGMPGIICRSNLRAKDPVGGYTVFDVKADSMFVYEEKIGAEKKLWASISLRDNYAKILDKRPDFSVNDSFPQIKMEWMKQTGVGIYSSPVLYKDNIYIADGKGNLICYDMKGSEKWRFTSGNRIFGTPAVADGIIVFGSTDKNIYGLRAKDGKKMWTVAASEPVIGAVAIEKGIAYIGASDHIFRAINIKNGTVIWQYDNVAGYVETRPLVLKDKIVFGAWDNTLYALSKKNGTECWRWTGGLTRMHFSPAAVWPVYSDNKVFIVDPQRAMTAINEMNGETIWRTRESTVRETIGLSKDKLRVYGKTMNDSIVCFSTGDEAHKLWACNVGFGYEFAPSMLVEKDDVVFGSTKNGLVFAIEAKSGKLLWKYKICNSLINTVMPLSKKRVVFSAASGEIGILMICNGRNNN